MSNRLQVLVPEELDRRITKAARRNRLSKGAWVRKALEAALAPTAEDDPVARLAELSEPIGDIEQVLREIEQGRE